MPSEQQDQSAQIRSYVCENFLGCNTATTRAGVDERQAYWIDGFIPLAPRNLRTLYGIGSLFYQAASGVTVVCFYAFNIGSAPCLAIFLSDGSVVQGNTLTGFQTLILPPGTIGAPSITTLGVSQWGQQYLLIVANQTNGYWIWDGSIVYTAGTLAPSGILSNSGSGYFAPPRVTVTGGHGSGATFVATIAGGQVTKVAITNPGSGYLATDTLTLNFNGGNTGGTGAALTAHMSAAAGGGGASGSANWSFLSTSNNKNYWTPGSFNVVAAGAGYSLAATAAFTSGTNVTWQANAAPSLQPVISGGAVIGFTLVANPSNPNSVLQTPLSGYTYPVITVSDPGYHYVSSVTIGNGGSNYGPNCTITASGGDSPVYSQATIVPIIAGGVISNTSITSGGEYSTTTPPTLTVTDSAVTAAGSVTLAPFGIQGNTIQTYQGHVWVFDVDVFNFSAPGSVSSFATSAGGGSQQSSVNYLKVSYIGAVSTNGFLFLIGDSSMDYISGVSTTTPSGGSPTTSFTQNNSDPEVGTPYPAAITTLGQEILIANSTGVQLSSGGEFVKRSEAMDGVYNTVSNFDGKQLSAAKATIFGKRVWMVLVPLVDPVSGATVNKILMFRDDGKIWWASEQEVPLTFITGQEINSVYTAWGTDGTHIYPLFVSPSVGFTKLVQTRYWDAPGQQFTKAVSRFWSLWQYFNPATPAISLTVDSVGIGAAGQYTNSQDYSFPGGTTGYYVTPPEAVGQQGVLNGFTLETNCADVALISAMLEPDEPAASRG